jgi:hypothetical protein
MSTPASAAKLQWMPQATRESAFSSTACVRLVNERVASGGLPVDEVKVNARSSLPKN